MGKMGSPHSNDGNSRATENARLLLARATPAYLVLLFVATLPGLIHGLVSPSRSPVVLIYSVPKLMYIALHILILVGAWFLRRKLLRGHSEQYLPVFQHLINILGRPWLAVLLGVTLVTGTLFCSGIIRAYFSLWMLPVIYIYIGVVFIPLLIVNWYRLSGGIEKTQPMWAGLGITLCVTTFLVAVIYFVNLPQIKGVIDPFLDVPSEIDFASHEVLSENPWHSPGASRWLSFVYHRSSPFEGKYYNIDRKGIRRTSDFVKDGRENAPRVFAFGGSTVWGVGARDDHTIPSCLARVLHEEYDQDVRVTSLAEMGYVSTQDLILFVRQLQLGDLPDVAVFIQGFNDVAAVWTSGYAGIPSQEMNRIRDFDLGRSLFWRALRNQRGLMPGWLMNLFPSIVPPQFLPGGAMGHKLQDGAPNLDMSLVSKGGSAKDIVDIYLENVRVIRTLSKAYGVRPLFVWQPTPWIAKPLASHERKAVAEIDGIFPDARQLFVDTDAEIRRRMEVQPVEGFLDLSRIFEERPEITYIDEGHYTEEGNRLIGRQIALAVAEILSKLKED